MHPARGFVLCALSLATIACAPGPGTTGSGEGQEGWEARHGDYLGEELPGSSPEVFAEGIVSTGLATRDFSISADGNEVYYTLMGQGAGTLVTIRRDEGADGPWSKPQIVSFSGLYSDIEPFLHPAGHRLYFASQRPLPGESEPGDWNLWVADRTEAGWADPEPLSGINTDGHEFYPAVTSGSALYFTGRREDSIGREDLYRAAWNGTGYDPPVNVGAPVNTPHDEFNAWVSPDDSMLIFGSVREGDSGGGDLYVSVRGEDGAWQEARNLGPGINSPRLDYCPFVSPDGRWLFFTSNRTNRPDPPRTRTYEEAFAAFSGPRNGNDSLFWVDASVLRGDRN